MFLGPHTKTFLLLEHLVAEGLNTFSANIKIWAAVKSCNIQKKKKQKQIRLLGILFETNGGRSVSI